VVGPVSWRAQSVYWDQTASTKRETVRRLLLDLLRPVVV
jgi:hypothetical protein